jgi:hypothetical protein
VTAGEFIPAGAAVIKIGEPAAVEKEDGLPPQRGGLTYFFFEFPGEAAFGVFQAYAAYFRGTAPGKPPG